jgi:hypothetical protein
VDFHPRLIASMDWVKSGEGLRAMRDVLPAHTSYPRKFDMLVVDEAHNIAPPPVRTTRWRASAHASSVPSVHTSSIACF